MKSVWTEHAGRLYHVLGIEASDPPQADVSKKIVIASMAMLVLIIFRAIFLMCIGEPIGSSILTMILNLSLPILGLMSIHDKGRLSLGIFIGLVLLHAIACMVSIGLVIKAVATGALQYEPSGRIRPFEMTSSLWVEVITIALYVIIYLGASYYAWKLFASRGKGDEGGLVIRSEHELTKVEIGEEKANLVEVSMDKDVSPVMRRKSVGGSNSPRE